MKSKKTTQKQVEKKSTIYFLIGLNLVLAGVYLMFGTQSPFDKAAENTIEIRENLSASTFIEVEEELIPIPEEPVIELPEPKIDLTNIEETIEPLAQEPMVDISISQHSPIQLIPTRDKNLGLDKLNELEVKASLVEEEKTIKPISPNLVTHMAIYPGCEKYKDNKRALIQCFGSKLSVDLASNLDTTFPDVDKDELVVQLQFKVDTNGQIVDINPIGDEALKKQAKQALERVAKKLGNKKKGIEPARMTDDTKAILKMTNTVVLQRQN